ncbi:MAG: hypothetical protein KDC92_06700, partial [Bacteroidetes bacterium]|nr:hypothetical protein [Bacteroidota bacterium]
MANNPNVTHKEDALHLFFFPVKFGSKGTDWVDFLGDNKAAINGPFEVFSDNGGNSSYLTIGTLSHEIGHLLGLKHTNRFDNGPCNSLQNDYCDDTPPSGSLNPCKCPPPSTDDCGCWNGLASDNGHTGDDEPCSNNMMTYNAKANALTPCQIGRMHYFLMHNGPNNYWINDYCDYDANETITIPSGTGFTWANTRYLKGDLVIESGATLTLKCYLSLPEGAEIIVKAGGKLIIDGGRVGNVCEETFAGIRVYGNSHSNQTSSSQGLVILKNGATIENAKIGISLIGKKTNGDLDWNSCGGYVLASDAVFKNNRKDVEFMSYHPKNSGGFEVNNRSYFFNCEFITDNFETITINSLAFREHVTMWDVNGVRFLGCTFEDQRSGMAPVASRTGLFSIHSNYEINHRCINMPNCTNYDKTKFINLSQGVSSYGNGSKGLIRLENCEFETFNGVYLNGTFESQVRANS